jgi:hypothetical protein
MSDLSDKIKQRNLSSFSPSAISKLTEAEGDKYFAAYIARIGWMDEAIADLIDILHAKLGYVHGIDRSTPCTDDFGDIRLTITEIGNIFDDVGRITEKLFGTLEVPRAYHTK